MSESQIGDYLSRITDDETSFAELDSERANCFLRFAGDWLRISDRQGLDLEFEFDCMRAALQGITQFRRPEKYTPPQPEHLVHSKNEIIYTNGGKSEVIELE